MAKATGYDSLRNNRTYKLAHSAAVEATEIIVSNDRVLVAISKADISIGVTYVYEAALTFPKKSATAFSAMARVYWDSGNDEITDVAAGNIACGFCERDAASADTTIRIFLIRLDIGAGGLIHSHIIIAAGSFTTAGGDPNETITIADALATDICHVTVNNEGASPVTLLEAQAASGQIDVVMSADPSTDHILDYSLIRAVI